MKTLCFEKKLNQCIWQYNRNQFKQLTQKKTYLKTFPCNSQYLTIHRKKDLFSFLFSFRDDKMRSPPALLLYQRVASPKICQFSKISFLISSYINLSPLPRFASPQRSAFWSENSTKSQEGEMAVVEVTSGVFDPRNYKVTLHRLKY